MKKIKVLFLVLLCLSTIKIYAMDLVHTPTISGKIIGFNLENELSQKELKISANLVMSASGKYLITSQSNKLYLLDLKKIPKRTTKEIKSEHILLINDHTLPTETPMPIAIVEQNNALLICSAVNINTTNVEIIIHKIVNNKPQIVYQKTLPGNITALTFNKDGSHLAIAYKQIKQSAYITLLNISSLKNIKHINTFPKQSNITTLTFSPDDATLLAGTNKGTLYFVDLEKAQLKNKVIVRKNNFFINAVTYVDKNTIELSTQDGCVTILNGEGEFKKSFYSVCLGNTKEDTQNRNNVAIAPHSPAVAFCLTNAEKKESDNQLSCVEFQVGNRIFTLHASQFNPIFFKKDKGHYAHIFKGYLACLGVSDLVENKYIVAALSTDSQIHIWEIPVSKSFRKLRPGTSRILDNGSLSKLKNKLEKELNEKEESKETLHYISHNGLLPKKRLTLKELLIDVKKEEHERRKKHPRPAPPLPPSLNRANTTIIRKPLRNTPQPRSYSVDTGIRLINKSTNILDIIHKRVSLQIKINMLTTLLNREKTANINEKDKYGNTTLYWEIQRSNIDIVKLLLKNRANPNTKNKDGNSPLHAAVQKKNYPMIELLLDSNANPNIQNNSNDTPAHYAAKNNFYKIITLLLKSKAHSCIPNKNGNTILHTALIHDQQETTQEIMKRATATTFSWQNQEGNTPLHIAVRKKLNELALKFIKKKASLNVQNYNGDTPLHIAVQVKNNKMISVLTKKGALYNVPNNQGKTALDLMK